MEHHSNIVPWQLVCQQTGATLKVAPITDVGELDLDAFHALLSERTKLLAIIHVSNSLGTINPVADLVAAARAVGAVTLVDGAQAVPHLPVDVQALGATSTRFPATRCTARRAPASCTAGRPCSRPCRPIRAAAT